jgi:hypothetical protein
MASLTHKDAILAAVVRREGVDSGMRMGDPSSDAEGILRQLDASIDRGTKHLLGLQKADGHWVFELEADATIPAEYVMLRHYLDDGIDPALEQRVAAYLRSIQGEHGGWPRC